MAGQRKGMALVIVLVLCTGLLSLGLWFIGSFRQRVSINPLVLERVQVDFFAQGILQAAMLKFKKIPYGFYYAYIARGTSPDYLNTYLSRIVGSRDAPLLTGTSNGDIKSLTGQDITVNYQTDVEMVYNRVYNQDGIVIQVRVQTPNHTRTVSHTIDVTRLRVSP